MHFESRDICQLIETIWAAMFGCEMRTRCLDGDAPRAAHVVTGLVPISGAWSGVVALECPVGLGRQVASLMFDTPAELITVDQIHDAIGELTNIVSGNFKTLLPDPSYLGLPTVAEGEDYLLRFPGSEVVVKIAGETSDFTCHVTILTSAQCRSAWANSPCVAHGATK